MNKLALSLMVGGFWSLSVIAAVSIPPGKSVNVNLSNRDVNRLHCINGDMNDVFYSEEKGLLVQNEGENAYVKFIVKVTGDERDYVQDRNELYVTCAGKVYTLLVTPMDIPAQTIDLLDQSANSMEANIALLGPLQEEDRAVKLTVDALNGQLQKLYAVKSIHEPASILWRNNIIQGAAVRQVASQKVLGLGFAVDEYHVKLTSSLPQPLDEKALLQRYFGDAIFAITLDPVKLIPNRITRAIVIRKAVHHD